MLGMGLLAAAGIGLIFLCLRLGSVGISKREESPLVFWAGIALLGLGVGLCLLALIALALTR
jgi:hypothetical protein